MIRQRVNRVAAAVLPCGLVAVLACGLSAAGASAKEPDGFVVHEWGTFSTFAGSDGRQLKFYPNDRDLPDFMHSRHRDVKGGLTDSLVSLETPVMYFYTDRDRTVSVHVDFPKGLMTDWYPQASAARAQSALGRRACDGEGTAEAAGDGGKGRYFAARETDAATVRASVDGRGEVEKFLFYRGVGDFQMPFVVKAQGDGKFTVQNTGKHAVPGFFLVRVQDRKVTFKALGHLSPGVEERIELPAEGSTAEKLGDAVAALLVQQGLYENEARAMVKTWSGDWFGDDGTRVLYLLAEPVTDEFLPLKIDPKPDRTVRVLVGRHDVLAPEREREIDATVARLNGPSNAESKAADASLNKLGRYRWGAQKAAEDRLRAAGVTRAGR